MRKIMALVLAVMMLCAVIAGCTQNKNNETTNNTTTAKTDKQTTSQTTTEPKKTTTETTTEKKEPITPADKKAFDGEIGDILDKIVAKAKEIDTSEYGIGAITCHHREITANIAVDILGIDDEEFAKLIDFAIESQPDGSWFTHSVIVIKFKDGIDVKAAAETIRTKSIADRCGCLTPDAWIGALTGDYMVFTISDSSICEAVYKAVCDLSACEVTRLDRENDWKRGGMFE